MVTKTKRTFDLEGVATHLAYAMINMRLLESNTRTKAYAIARAKLEGACKALNAAGLGMAPFEIELTVHEAWIAAVDQGARPPFHSMNNAAQQAWDSALASRVLQGLTAL